jgi:hypothetical protein
MDAMEQCRRDIVTAIERYEQASGNTLLTAQLMHCNERGVYRFPPEATHRIVILGITFTPEAPLPWAEP